MVVTVEYHDGVLRLIDQRAPSVLYIGTDAGVFKTTSAGDRWLPARQGLEERNIRALTLDPRRPARLFAATDAGVFRSDDRGEHWNLAREGLNNLDVRALGIDPQSTSICMPMSRPSRRR